MPEVGAPNPHESAEARAKEFFEALWAKGDPWDLESSSFERDKYASQLALVGDRQYAKILEIGCGAGTFTSQLGALANSVIGLDVAENAIDVARARNRAPDRISFKAVDVMNYEVSADGPFDLIVLSETIYYLGWLYPFFDVAWMASQLSASMVPGGRLLMANTCGGLRDYLLQPWLIRTYQDMFVNVGFEIEREETFRGRKNDVDLQALLTLFQRTSTV